MKAGCIAYDTIQELDSASFKELLDSTSSCVVELHWQGKETIDLLFLLSICFVIHSDKLAHRYTLQSIRKTLLFSRHTDRKIPKIQKIQKIQKIAISSELAANLFVPANYHFTHHGLSLYRSRHEETGFADAG